jgi:hypothetical protein
VVSFSVVVLAALTVIGATHQAVQPFRWLGGRGGQAGTV